MNILSMVDWLKWFLWKCSVSCTFYCDSDVQNKINFIKINEISCSKLIKIKWIKSSILNRIHVLIKCLKDTLDILQQKKIFLWHILEIFYLKKVRWDCIVLARIMRNAQQI